MKAIFNKLQQLLEQAEGDSQSITQNDNALNLATAALMVEVATIDQQFDKIEMAALKKQLLEQFSVDTNTVDRLIEEATTSSADSSSLYEFTQLINQHFNDEQKFMLAVSLWKVAYADENLDKYEEHIIRRITDLIHLRHSDFIRAKKLARSDD